MDVAPAHAFHIACQHPLISRVKTTSVEDPEAESLAKRMRLMREKGWEDGVKLMREMAGVEFQQSGGGTDSNEKRTEGFVYKYENGEVGIVCTCHGTFLSPDEFVEHAGEVDIGNPMKQVAISVENLPI